MEIKIKHHDKKMKEQMIKAGMPICYEDDHCKHCMESFQTSPRYKEYRW
tara:strand:+ start:63 stop:209 length:147 start_codon:yes stop_codon:yes gene_type:complete